MKDNIKIVDSVPQDVFGIRNVQRITWIDTYPNAGLNILKEDVESEFSKDDTEEGRKRIEGWKKLYSNSNMRRWVAKKGSDIIGFCSAVKENEGNRIYAIYVLPEFQRQGLGKKLMEKALVWLGREKDIYVNSASYNIQALKFYEKFGFNKSSRSVNSTVEPLPTGKAIPEIEMVKKA